MVTFQQGDEIQQIAIRYVEGTRYLNRGDSWIQAPDRTFSDVSELTLLTPQNILSIVGQMEVIGTETVNEPPAQDDFVSRNELGALLGFNRMFPTGTTVETVVGTHLYIVGGPYALDEATSIIELNMEANGYRQISKEEAPSGAVIYNLLIGRKSCEHQPKRCAFGWSSRAF